jgi:hypothetical protein
MSDSATIPALSRSQVKAPVLTFDDALDPTRATNLANDRLVSPGRDRRFGARDDQTIISLRARATSSSRSSVRALAE